MDRLVAFSRRRRRWLLLVAAGAATVIGAYKIYHHPAVAARRRRLVRLAAAVAAFADAAASSADAAALVASDLADFVRSDSDELPRSVTQLAKLAASPEVSATVSALSEAVTAGILRGVGSSNSGPGSGGSVALSDRLVDKLFSDSGERLASAVAGSFARHLVLAFYSVPSPPGEASSTMWVNVVATGRCRKAISNWVEVFVGTAVREFIDKTIHINTYEQLFEGLTNPKHDAKVKGLLVSVCNGAVETLVKTTHHVMSSTNDKLYSSGSGSGNSNVGVGEGWVETVSSTLEVPSNRKFVLDVTGRVTFETVRSFLEFILWKLQDGARKGGGTVVDSGLRVVRYMSDKSMVIATICITLCLHVLNGTRLLVTA
ncbi:protein PHLOEM PROTEIN 2-LIKE A10-like [Phragmites australis]|uniref:protein PHLOEM PROTEIN 2-LIKE A10-like n=1 Tax=Phragmites australis TaxID=29695 RepID=UPI002D79CB19|nr:protein PHLOEM PROTEIN 2-LIKE A10-like [Phragmites australis]